MFLIFRLCWCFPFNLMIHLLKLSKEAPTKVFWTVTRQLPGPAIRFILFVELPCRDIAREE
jgi:hypothetical protein